MSILDSITERYGALTRSGQKLANFILDHASEAQYLSIHAMARRSGVSEASITRFCRRLGLSGYNDLRLALAKEERTTNPGDTVTTPEAIRSADDLAVVCRKLCDTYHIALRETREQLDPAAFARAAGLLAGAENVYCLGQGASMVMAMEAWARFSTVSSRFRHIADSHMQMMAVSVATPRDAILFFSYSGSTKDVLELLRLAKERQVPVILITHFANSPAAAAADVTLLCGYNESPLQTGSVAAKMGQLLLIDCLFYACWSAAPDSCRESRSLVTDALTRKML